MPWQEGYSTTHFYKFLEKLVSSNENCSLNSIQYSSPGYMKINATDEKTKLVLDTINTFAQSKSTINSTYNMLSKRIKELDLNTVTDQEAFTGVYDERL